MGVLHPIQGFSLIDGFDFEQPVKIIFFYTLQ